MASATIAAEGGTRTITVSAQPECAWTATANVNWISFSATSGQGTGALDIRVAPNGQQTAREASVQLNDETIRITQQAAAPCEFVVAPDGQSFGPGGGTGDFDVATTSNCTWTPVAATNWITVTDRGSGSGNGSVEFRVDANTGPARTGSIRVGNRTFDIAQGAAVSGPCIYTLPESSAAASIAGGPSVIALQTSAGCAWTATSAVPWVVVTSAAGGSGPATIAFRVDPNPGPARVGTVAIGPEIFTVRQAGVCAFALSSTSQSVSGGAGTGSPITVTTPVECDWTAASTVPWLTVTSEAASHGVGTVTFTFAANTGQPRTGALVIAGQTVTVAQAGACSYSLSSTELSVAAAASSGGPITVTTQAGCAWTAASNAQWLTVTAGASGSMTGPVSFSIQANSGAPRSGTLTIGGQTFTVKQAGTCAYSINPANRLVGATATAGTIAVSTADGCSWTAVSNAQWITVAAPGGGNGPGTASYTVAANTGAPRSGTITVAGQTFTVNQDGSCAYSINPTSQNVAVGAASGTPIAVATAAGCNWTAASNVNWLTVPTSSQNGSGPGTVNFSIVANTGAPRSGTLTVAGQTFTVNQAGVCSYSINPTSQSAPIGGGSGTTISVTTTTGCDWTAAGNVTWLTVPTSSRNGSGPGTVNFSIAANSGGPRTGTLTVAGQTFTVNQAGNCSYSINPTSQSAPIGGGAGTTITVTTAAGCNWTAAGNVNWLAVPTSSQNGSGPGTVNFTIGSNPDAPRTGTLTVAGQTFTVNQAGTCAFSINPTSATVPGDEGPIPTVTVTTTSTCSWSATSNVNWITVSSPTSSVNGTGQVTMRASRNNGSRRTGTVTIAGQTFTVTQDER